MNQLALIEKTEETGTDIAVLRSLTPAIVFTPNGGDPIIEAIRRKYIGDGDISTAKGRDEIRSRAFECAKDKKAVERLGTQLADDVRASLNPIIAERQRMVEEIQKIQDECRRPLTEWESAEKSRIDKHEAAIAEIVNSGTYTSQNWQSLPLDAMRDRLAEVEKERLLDWQEFRVRAQSEIDSACDKITNAINLRQRHDAEQAELQRFREAEAARIAEEQRIAAEAAEALRITQAVEAEKARADAAARVEAARVEHEKIAAEQRAAAEKVRLESERKAAEDRAAAAELARIEDAKKAKFEADRAAAEAKKRGDALVAAAIEQERLAAALKEETERKAIAAREADQSHRREVNGAALEALKNIGLEPELAKAVISAIVKGDVPYVSIAY